MPGDPKHFNLGAYWANGEMNRVPPDDPSDVGGNQVVTNFTHDQNITMTFNHTVYADVEDHIVMAWVTQYVLSSTDYYFLRRILSDHCIKLSHIALGLQWTGRILRIQDSGEGPFLPQQVPVRR